MRSTRGCRAQAVRQAEGEVRLVIAVAVDRSMEAMRKQECASILRFGRGRGADVAHRLVRLDAAPEGYARGNADHRCRREFGLLRSGLAPLRRRCSVPTSVIVSSSSQKRHRSAVARLGRAFGW